MSLGGVTDFLTMQGCAIGRFTVHDNLRQAGTVARHKPRERLRSKMKVRVVATDCTPVTKQQVENLPPSLPSPDGLSVAQALDDMALLEEALARAPGSGPSG
jgi:hypothetical protein